MLVSWESFQWATSHFFDPMRAHKCLRFKDKISLSRDASLEDRDRWDLLGSWESLERATSHSIDLMRAHNCISLKDRISPTRSPLEGVVKAMYSY